MSDGNLGDWWGAGGLHGGVNQNPSNQDIVRPSFDEPATRDFDSIFNFQWNFILTCYCQSKES